MRYALNVAYLGLLFLLSPWWIYAAIFRGKYREGYAAKLLGQVPRRDGHGRCIWMHAVSVGEVNLLQPLIDRLPETLPDWDCYISTTTKTGYDLARRKYRDFPVFYCPLDFSWSVANAMRRLRPDVVLLAELELWPNLIAAARRHGAKVAIVNGRLSDHSARGYRSIGWLVKRLLGSLDLVAVQNEEYARRFIQLGAAAETVEVTGSLKFDGAETDRDNPQTRALAQLAGIGEHDVVFLAGSTQHPEESLALQTFARLSADNPTLRLILAPRHPNRCDEVARLLEETGLPWQRRSRLNQEAATDESSQDQAGSSARILLVDTVGELAAWWGTAQIAFVGGSMGSRGGQNMIEPAAYGAAVSFGPNTKNFRDVVRRLLAGNAAEMVEDGGQLETFVARCLQDPAWAAGMGSRAQELVRQQLGATDRTLALLANLGQTKRPDKPALTIPTGDQPERERRDRAAPCTQSTSGPRQARYRRSQSA